MLRGTWSRLSWGGIGSYLDTVRLSPGTARVVAAGRDFWSLLFPSECVVCGIPSSALCPGCHAAVRAETVRPFRAEDGAHALPSRADTPGEAPAIGNFTALPVTAAGHYRSALARSLLAYKNHHRTDAVRPLQAALAGALHSAVSEVRFRGEAGPVLLVPVPAKGASMRRRGYDPLALLLGGLQRRGELPADCRATRLVGYRRTPWRLGPALAGQPPLRQQKGLGRARRRANVRLTMSLRTNRSLTPGVMCLVVDDVLTTGATIAEMTRVLRLGDADVVGAVVIAATPPPSLTE